MELRELIQRAVEGENKAWETLVERFSPLVWRILGKFESLSQEDKKDLSQEVWFSLLKGGLRAFHGPTDGGSTEHVFRAFLKITTKRKAIGYLLRHGRPLEVLVPFLWGEGDEGESLGSLLADPSLGPEGKAALKELLEQLRLCLQALPHLNDQEIFWMRGLWGYSFKEIAETFDLSLGTVTAKYYRAEEKIKECLEKAGYEYGGKNR